MAIAVKKKKFVPPALQITSMMDMFTIIVFFLMFAYSDKPQEITIKEKMDLPTSNSMKDYSNAVKVLISKNTILVDDEPVATVAGDSISGLSDDDLESSTLFKVLKVRKSEETSKATDTDKAEDSKPVSLLFFCDRQTPYKIIQSVMKVAALAGYPNFQLAVLQES